MKILFFASLKASLKESEINVDLGEGISVLELKSLLIERFGKYHFKDNIICAVNQEIVKDNHLIINSDEIAFYPPVTGG
jgi:molybdopterin synthase sulfur carrier subunit